MEYVYAAMLIHKAGHKVTEDAVKKTMTAAGAHPDDARVKALVAALENVNIDEAVKQAAMAAPVAAAPVAHAHAEGGKKEHKKEEDAKPSAEEAAAGLGALFG